MGSGISTPQQFNEKAHFDEQTLSERFPKFRDIKIKNVIPQRELGIPDQNYPRLSARYGKKQQGKDDPPEHSGSRQKSGWHFHSIDSGCFLSCFLDNFLAY